MKTALGTGVDNVLFASASVPAPAAPTLTAPTASTAAVYVGQNVTVSATTTDGDLDEMRWIITTGGAPTQVASDATSPYSQTWTVSEGVAVYTIVARAVRAGITTDSAPLTIYILPAAPIWFRGDTATASGGAVSSWTDRGPGGYHATQATEENKPAQVADALNGQGVIRFDGGDLLSTATVDYTAKTGATMFVVAKDASAATMILVEKGDLLSAGGFALYANVVAGKLSIAHKGDADPFKSKAGDSGQTLASATIVEHVYDLSLGDTAEAKQFINGTEESTYTVSNGAGANNASNLGNTAFDIGARTGIVAPFTGDIAEIIIYDTTQSAGNRSVLRAYLGARYGITVS